MRLPPRRQDFSALDFRFAVDDLRLRGGSAFWIVDSLRACASVCLFNLFLFQRQCVLHRVRYAFACSTPDRACASACFTSRAF